MKYAYATTLFLLAATCALQGAAKDDALKPIPKEKEGRWGIYSYTEAKEEAGKKKRPIAVIYQDERAEEASEKAAVLKTFWGVQKDASVLLVASRLAPEAKTRIPEAYTALVSAEAGKSLPRLVVMSQDGTIPLGIMTTEQIMASDEKGFKEFIKKMDEANKNPSASKLALTTPGAKPAAPAPAAPAATPGAAPTTPGAPAAPAGPVAIKDPKPESWTSAEGKAVQMTLVSVNGSEATFQMANGKTVPLDVSKLSDASKKRVEELVTASK
ncbi:hypothetical protein [Roseimicrobium sp. ORNL1]|uniref:hypothetical protein n=1 Tax=Roseimicrobium sp. ORNL1 TaxID=2711231 RepID=UPI0013E14942|nr:hypothetical protein [Roseimicrobium sp. ORNL1]QIE99962.1 hypothetical protein G5S37_09460 [Roseimicrobium sp. ORNL1]